MLILAADAVEPGLYSTIIQVATIFAGVVGVITAAVVTIGVPYISYKMAELGKKVDSTAATLKTSTEVTASHVKDVETSLVEHRMDVTAEIKDVAASVQEVKEVATDNHRIAAGTFKMVNGGMGAQ